MALLDVLTGEAPPRRMLAEVVLLVLVLHLWILIRFLEPVVPATQPKPLMMEISMISAPGHRNEPTPPVPRPEPPKPKPKKKKSVVKKKPKVPKQPQQETVPVPDAKPVSEPDPSPPTAQTSTSSKPSSEAMAAPFTEANFRANYGFNPKPVYPRLARNRGWQGKVLLRVQVSADGLSERVTVFHGSGHEILDESAVAAVEKWRFIPAMRGTTPVPSSVIVPIIFTLHN